MCFTDFLDVFGRGMPSLEAYLKAAIEKSLRDMGTMAPAQTQVQTSQEGSPSSLLAAVEDVVHKMRGKAILIGALELSSYLSEFCTSMATQRFVESREVKLTSIYNEIVQICLEIESLGIVDREKVAPLKTAAFVFTCRPE